MFAARRIVSIAPRVAFAARPTVVPTACKAFATTSIARFLNTNVMEQKRATVQRNLDTSFFLKKKEETSLLTLFNVDPAPQWSATSLVDGEFKELALSDYKGKFVVMVFYPADFTFVCPTELLAFSDRIEEFRQLGAEVVGVSVE